jgi:staphylococcal nuclease domain-containing protein 1
MQRDVEFEVDSIDKSGGFIGSLYLNKTENAALTLVKEGLATAHSFSADGLSWARQLYDTEVSDLFSESQNYSHDYLIGRGKASKAKCKGITKVLQAQANDQYNHIDLEQL